MICYFFAIFVYMTASSDFGSFASSGGTGDDGNDPSRKGKLPNTHSIDNDPSFTGESDDTGNNEVINVAGSTVAFNQAPLSWATPPVQLQTLELSHPFVYFPYKCEVCGKRFRLPKALYGHMRSHPERKWRGVLPPALCPRAEREMADFLVEFSGRGEATPKFSYQCSGCLQEFPTKQALGGHRASHKNRVGCCAKEKHGLINPAASVIQHKKVASKKWLKVSGPAKMRGINEGIIKPMAVPPVLDLVRTSPRADGGYTAATNPPDFNPIANGDATAVQEPSKAMEIDNLKGGGRRGGKRRMMLDLNLPAPQFNESNDAADGDNAGGDQNANSPPCS